MIKYSLILITSFSITILFTPVAKRIAFMANVLDNPVNELKIHKKPIPYLGGIALLLGVLISLSIAGLWFSFNQTYLWGILASTIVITFLGLLDDLFDIKQTYKFVAQLLIASGIVYIGFRVGTFPYIAIPLTIFYIIGACNALNLLDGLDGLAAGVSAISSLFFFLLFLMNNDTFGIILSLSLFGACAAFLFYNFNPASIFMGDAGSMLLGIMLSILMIRYSETPFDFKSFFTAILICGVPVFDTALTYLRRYLNNKPIFPGDRSHFYDQLIDRGFPVKKTVLISYSIGILFGIIALIMRGTSDLSAFIIFISILFALFVIVMKMDMLRIRK
jgi:UDP-GlcNAc:undecaprenyl-phosphate GlcNAc-1-phosphate transferase